MKNVVIFHGTEESPEHFWYPWLINNLRVRNIPVRVKPMPECDAPPSVIREKFSHSKTEMTPDSILIGHFSGCPVILSLLENLEFKINKSILIAGFRRPNGPNRSCPLVLRQDYDWDAIKEHCGEFIFINSDIVPSGCDDMQGKEIFEHLGGTLIIKKNGRFGSDSFEMPSREFPLLLKLVED